MIGFAIVTVIHDSEAELGGLLDSVTRHLDPRPRVIVVDSGSTDDGGAALRASGAPRSWTWAATPASAPPTTRASSGCASRSRRS